MVLTYVGDDAICLYCSNILIKFLILRNYNLVITGKCLFMVNKNEQMFWLKKEIV